MTPDATPLDLTAPAPAVIRAGMGFGSRALGLFEIAAVAIALSACMSEWRGAKYSDAEAVRLCQRFERLHPPFSSTEARGILGDGAWIARAAIWRQTCLGGYVPLRRFGEESAFCVALTKPKGQKPNHCIWLNTTSDIQTPDQLRAFFSGCGPPASRVNEFGLCSPEWDGVRSFP